METFCKLWIFIGAIDSGHHEFVRHILDYVNEPCQIFAIDEERNLKNIYNQQITHTSFFSLGNLLSTEERNIILLPHDINLADSINEMYNIFKEYNIEVEKVISIADAQIFIDKKQVLLDAMAHFSDILFIYDSKSQLKKPQIDEFIHHCKKQECYPLPIEYISKKSEHLNELFFDDHRRMTLVFDDIDPVDMINLDDNNLPTESFTIPTVDQLDKYLARDDMGKRNLQIPEF